MTFQHLPLPWRRYSVRTYSPQFLSLPACDCGAGKSNQWVQILRDPPGRLPPSCDSRPPPPPPPALPLQTISPKWVCPFGLLNIWLPFTNSPPVPCRPSWRNARRHPALYLKTCQRGQTCRSRHVSLRLTCAVLLEYQDAFSLASLPHPFDIHRAASTFAAHALGQTHSGQALPYPRLASLMYCMTIGPLLPRALHPMYLHLPHSPNISQGLSTLQLTFWLHILAFTCRI